MTIQYKHLVSTASPSDAFNLMCQWKGSVWKAIWRGLVLWIILYEAISLFYTFCLTRQDKKAFRKVSLKMNEKMSYIPLEFILGFFVSAVAKRWSDVVRNMGYLDDAAIYVGNIISGVDEETRKLRRTIIRYLCLTQVLVFRDICENVRKRFPNYDSVVKAGFLLPEEKDKLMSYSSLDKITSLGDEGKYCIPLNWAFQYAIQARRDGKIVTDMWCTRLTEEIKKLQNSMQTLCNYDWVKIPLAYPQLHVAFPLITVLQYIFYVGWMKVAAGLLNPLDEREDCLETNFLIDRNFSTSLFIVDNARDDLPELKKDEFWENDLHYSQVNPPLITDRPLVGSAAHARYLLTLIKVLNLQ
uniref:Bestrophin homolog n=1 Tax=Syphacia muris TaxID=451379 RepID=A0A0N5AEW2_9BILA